MPASNNNLNPEWQPSPFPGEDPGLWTWRKLSTQYIYQLRGMHSNLSQTVQNFNNNVTQAISRITQQIAVSNSANNNNATAKPPVIYGYSGTMWISHPPNVWTGYLFVQTDRNALYYSNGSAWLALEGIGTGSFENRWANLNSFDSGLFWIETSRNNSAGLQPYPTYRWDGANWNYLTGEFYRTQASLSTLSNTFAPANSANGNDVGARVNVTDFAGQLQWTNANNANAWAWGQDDCRMHGMGPILAEVDPSPTTGWALYDGNNYTYLKSDGTTGSVTLPNLIGSASAAFLEAGNVNSGVNPATAPVLTMNSYIPTGNITGGGVSSNTGSAIISVSGNGVTSNSGTFVTGVSGGGGTFVGDSAILTGNISNNGHPASLVRRPWFRR